jgi:hypothetical protein
MRWPAANLAAALAAPGTTRRWKGGQRANKAKAAVARLAPIVADIRASGTTVRAMSDELNRQKIASPRGGQWSKSTVAVLLSQLRVVWSRSGLRHLVSSVGMGPVSGSTER